MERKTAPTLKDIAREAGVSYVAASVVVNGARSNSRISDQTRERILKVAQEMQYSPNTFARGLKSIRLKTLGISFHTLDSDAIIFDPYSAAVLGGVVAAAHRACYNVTLFHKPWYDAKQSTAFFRDQGIDGFLIVAPLEGSDMVSGLASIGIPQVVISSPSDQHGVPSVDVDNKKGTRLVMEHLMSLGHKRIAHVMNHVEMLDTSIRRDTFLQVMAESGLPVPPEYLSVPEDDLKVGSGTYFAKSAQKRIRAMLSLPEPPTAIFTTNDTLAMQTMLAARELNIDIPGQLSIVGFDNNPIAAMAVPPLTTIRQPLWEMGEAATHMLIALVEGDPVPTATNWFEPELMVRESTAPPTG